MNFEHKSTEQLLDYFNIISIFFKYSYVSSRANAEEQLSVVTDTNSKNNIIVNKNNTNTHDCTNLNLIDTTLLQLV